MLFINFHLIVLIPGNNRASLQLSRSCPSKFNVNLITLPHYFICNGGRKKKTQNNLAPCLKASQVESIQGYFCNLSSNERHQQDSIAGSNNHDK